MMTMPRGMIAGPVLFLAFLMTPPGLLPEAAPLAAEPEAADFDNEVSDEAGAVYGRLRHLDGIVTLRRDDQISTDLVINDPIAPGDVLTTGPEARAELQLADGSLIRMDRETELVLQTLWDSTGQLESSTILQLAAGSILVRLKGMDASERRFQVDTDEASAFLLEDGVFRLDITREGGLAVASRRGGAEVMAREVSVLLGSGERVVVWPGRAPGDAFAYNTRFQDEFDGWAADRDDALVRHADLHEQEPEELPEPVEPYSTELSYYGRWSRHPSYGWVWAPAGVATDWRPYYYGRWAWSPTGLVWVSYEPWGWAPFHYGRWEFIAGGGWFWIPGFAFSGAHVAWGISPGYFGWCPLGYYNSPVAWSFGIHRSPWVYVRGHHLYERRVHTVFVRDVTIIRDVEQRRVIVRGHPVVSPRRVKESPRVTEELYRVARSRPDAQVGSGSQAAPRRVAFKEQERREQVKLDAAQRREARQAARATSTGAGAGSIMRVAPQNRNLPAPPSRRPQGAGTKARTSTGRRPEQAGTDPAPVPQRRVVPRKPEPRGAAPAPAQDAPPRNTTSPRLRSGRQEPMPQRIVPRIIPKPQPKGSSGGSQGQSQARSQQPRRSEPQRAPSSTARSAERRAPAPRPQQPRQTKGGGSTRSGGNDKKKD